MDLRLRMPFQLSCIPLFKACGPLYAVPPIHLPRRERVAWCIAGPGLLLYPDILALP
jgi:hypothetical protein